MSTARGILIVTALLLSAAVPARAQDPHHPGPPATAAPPVPGDGSAMTDGMMDRLMPMTGTTGHIDGWLAFLRAELKVTEAQATAWGDFADAVHANAARLGASHASMTHQDAGSPNLPARLLAQEQMMAGRLTALRRMREAIEPLYTMLSDAQKKTADELLGPQGMM